MQTDWLAEARQRKRAKRLKEFKDVMPTDAYQKLMELEQASDEGRPIDVDKEEIDWNNVAILYNDRAGSD